MSTPDNYVGMRLGSVPASAPVGLCNALMHTRTLCSLGRGPPGPGEAAGVGNCDAAVLEATALVPALPQAPPSLTFAVFAIPGVAGLADALIRPWRVLADGIDVAMVSPFHTLIHIWQGQRTCENHHAASQVTFEGVPKSESPLQDRASAPEVTTFLWSFQGVTMNPYCLQDIQTTVTAQLL